MNRRYLYLILIVVLLAVGIWIDLPNAPFPVVKRAMEPVLGLDLRGGLQVILSVPQEYTVTQQNLEDAKQILEARTNALGVAENRFQVAGDRNIVGEFPGKTNSEEVIAQIKQVGQLEFVDFGTENIAAGTVVQTDYALAENPQAAPEATTAPAAEATPAASATETAPAQVYHTVMTGTDLRSVSAGRDQLGNWIVTFELTDNGAQIFRDFTTANVGKILGIVLDKKVISAPRIETAITEGNGQISGNFDSDSANALAVNLRYGSLPVPLQVEQIRQVGATLGEDSLNKSLLAGAIGFVIVMLFMGIYYRVPGLMADISILFFAIVAFAVFIAIPVTMTLPGIAGFLLSTGSALDANILFFERMKEEIRNGRTLRQALDLGWRRAWPSIRDSNIAAMITSIILYWFGSTFGASIVQGFALTLALGVIISVFTAYIVTRTLLSTAVDLMKDPESHLNRFGI